MSGDEPYRWNQGLMLTPDQYYKLGQVMAALGPRVTELSNEPLAPEHRQLNEQELADLTGAISEADQEAGIRQSLPLGSYRRDLGLANDNLANFSRVHEMSYAAEQERITQDAAPLPRLAEDRMSHLLNRAARGTYTPAGYAAYSLAAQGGITGMETCGPAPDGYCMNVTHELGCGSSGDPAAVEDLRPAMERIAHRPYADADGRVWADAEFGAPMSLLDHVEASLGIRLGDKSLFETGRARREVAQVSRQQVWGDPDTPGSGKPFSASTRRIAQALADSSKGMLATSADVARQQAADKAQHARLAARIGKPRHQDYAVGLSNPVHQATELAQFEGGMLGNLPSYSRAGSVSGDEVWL